MTPETLHKARVWLVHRWLSGARADQSHLISPEFLDAAWAEMARFGALIAAVPIPAAEKEPT